MELSIIIFHPLNYSHNKDKKISNIFLLQYSISLSHRSSSTSGWICHIRFWVRSVREVHNSRSRACGAVSEVDPRRIMKFIYSDSWSHYRGHLATLASFPWQRRSFIRCIEAPRGSSLEPGLTANGLTGTLIN